MPRRERRPGRPWPNANGCWRRRARSAACSRPLSTPSRTQPTPRQPDGRPYTGPMEASTKLRLRVSPGAQRTGVVGRHGDGWKVRVVSAPEGGRANEELLLHLAKWLELPHRDISIVSGHTGRDKIVHVAGREQADSERRLHRASR